MKVAVDTVIFTIQAGDAESAACEAADPTFHGSDAIPGGFVYADEDLDQAALRELA